MGTGILERGRSTFPHHLETLSNRMCFRFFLRSSARASYLSNGLHLVLWRCFVQIGGRTEHLRPGSLPV